MGVGPLRTPRLLLRLPRAADVAQVAVLLNDPLISRHIPHIPYPFGLAQARKWVKDKWRVRKDAVHGRGYDFVMEHEGRIVGGCHISWNARDARMLLGYWVGKPYRGRGFATETTRALIEFGFRKLRAQKIWAIAFSDNRASRRVLENAGMQREMYLRSHVFDRGRRRADVYYGLTRADWSAARRPRLSARRPRAERAQSPRHVGKTRRITC